MMRADDSYAALEPWLNTLGPYEELVAPLALRSCFAGLLGDRSYGRRITELVARLDLNGAELLDALRNARARAREIKNAAEAVGGTDFRGGADRGNQSVQP